MGRMTMKTRFFACAGSVMVKVNGGMAFITYSQKLVSKTLAKINRYSKALEYLSSFYNRMVAQGRIQLNSNIFQQDFKKLNSDSLLAACIPTNLDTCLHWSAIGSNGILKTKRKFGITFEQELPSCTLYVLPTHLTTYEQSPMLGWQMRILVGLTLEVTRFQGPFDDCSGCV